MDKLNKWRGETLGKKTVQALEKNGFTAAYFADREEAVAHILSLVPDGASVGIGGSVTEKTLDLGGKLRGRGCTIHDHNLPDMDPEERKETRYRQLAADVFICSTNALTLAGELFNTDGIGNRVAAMIFGPKKVVVVSGTNKIVKDLAEADSRMKMCAAPKNNKRLETGNPCTEMGFCVDCRNPSRICNVTTIISRRPKLTDFHVIIIGEDLGY